jgi:hypothetical protein
MNAFQTVMSHADGYYGECLTNSHCWWSGNASIRNGLKTTMQLAGWLAGNNKVFFPNVGVSDGQPATRAEIDSTWAFFNLIREGTLQFYSVVTSNWNPTILPEMTKALGDPVESAAEINASTGAIQVGSNVYRRQYTASVSYYNMSDATVSINLPAGIVWQDSLGAAVASPRSLAPFTGLTVYGT